MGDATHRAHAARGVRFRSREFVLPAPAAGPAPGVPRGTGS